MLFWRLMVGMGGRSVLAVELMPPSWNTGALPMRVTGTCLVAPEYRTMSSHVWVGGSGTDTWARVTLLWWWRSGGGGPKRTPAGVVWSSLCLWGNCTAVGLGHSSARGRLGTGAWPMERVTPTPVC